MGVARATSSIGDTFRASARLAPIPEAGVIPKGVSRCDQLMELGKHGEGLLYIAYFLANLLNLIGL